MRMVFSICDVCRHHHHFQSCYLLDANILQDLGWSLRHCYSQGFFLLLCWNRLLCIRLHLFCYQLHQSWQYTICSNNEALFHG